MSQATFRFPRVHPQEQVRVTSDSPGSTLVAQLRADLSGQLSNLVGPDGVTTLYLQSETGTTTISGSVPSDGAALDAAVAAVVAGAPTALDTLDELAAALGDDSNYAATITTALSKRLLAISHGSTAGTARTSSTLPVLWVGTVAPTNAVARDLWLDESGPTLKRTADGSAWVAAGGTSVASVAFVNHGSVASTARPSGAGCVLWLGTVTPTNMTSADLYVAPGASVPGQVNTLTATSGDTSVALAWAAPTSNGGAAVTDYLVEYKATASGTWLTFGRTGTTTSATVTGLTNGTAYDFRVSAINAAGTGASSSASATPAAVVSTVISFASTNDGVTSGTARTFNLPATVAAGDILVLLIAQGQPGGYAWSATGWTSKYTDTTDKTMQVLTKVATGSEAGGTIAGAFNIAPGMAVIGACYALRNVSATPVASGATAQTFASTVAVPTGLGTLPADVIIIGCAGHNGSGTSTPPATWTEDFDGVASSISYNVAHLYDSDGGAQSGSWTFGGAANNSGIAVAFA